MNSEVRAAVRAYGPGAWPREPVVKSAKSCSAGRPLHLTLFSPDGMMSCKWLKSYNPPVIDASALAAINSQLSEHLDTLRVRFYEDKTWFSSNR